MPISRKRKRWLIIIGSILAILIILTLFANRILSYKADTLLREELSKMDTTSYVIDFDRIRVNLFSSSVRIYGIHVKPRQAVMENVKRSIMAKPVFEVKLERVRVSSIGIMKAIKGKEYSVGGITLTEPDITIYGSGEIFKGKNGNGSSSNIFSSDTLIETAVKQATLGSFNIEHAHIRYIDLGHDKTILETRDLNISVSDLWLHHPEGDTLAHVLEVDDIEIDLKSHSMELPGNFYSLHTGPLMISYKDQQVRLDSLRLIPAYPKGKFSKAFGKQTDRFEVSADQILVTGIVFDSLMNKKLIADQLKITNPYADIFRDKRVERDMNIFPKLFQTAIAGLPLQVQIGLVDVSGAILNYQEMVESSEVAGYVLLEQLDMKVRGICNDPDSIAKGQTMVIEANALLMGKSPFQAIFNLPIGNHAEYFTFHGSASSFPAVNLNPLIEPLALISASAGTITSVEFYAMAMNDTTAGRIEFKYQNLEVSVLRKKKEEEGIKQANAFVSFLARTAMHNNNPIEGKPVRIARMTFVRDRNKGFFNYVWKTIQDGLIVTITPGKKKLAEDLSWPDFKTNWRKNLLDDWHALQLKNTNKKSK